MHRRLEVLYPVYTIEQTSSKRRANVFKIYVLNAPRLLDVCSIIARRLFDVCLTFARCLLAFIQLARRAMVISIISMLIRRAGWL